MKLTVRIAKDNCSAIILIGNLQYAHSMNKYEELKDFMEKYYMYVVKHCDNVNIPTHIDKNGFVNRYGILISKNEIEFNGLDYIPFPKGIYKRHSLMTIEELKSLLN